MLAFQYYTRRVQVGSFVYSVSSRCIGVLLIVALPATGFTLASLQSPEVTSSEQVRSLRSGAVTPSCFRSGRTQITEMSRMADTVKTPSKDSISSSGIFDSVKEREERAIAKRFRTFDEDRLVRECRNVVTNGFDIWAFHFKK